MADYYSILGLTKEASGNDIKIAFRKLAKLYHPDKNPDNPNAKALFENVLKAYTVLSNPVTKKRYDNGYVVTTTQTPNPRKTTGKKPQKEYTFTEEDLKRRQYYQNYYQTKKQTHTAETKHKSYSDYKYILFATPLAVGLLMVILSVFSEVPNTMELDKTVTNKEVNPMDSMMSYLNTGDKPYSGYFGSIKTFETTHSLQINNRSDYDAVII
jgi:curved DNA-binding protein CbpA